MLSNIGFMYKESICSQVATEMNDKIFLCTILPWYLLSIHNTLPTNLSDRHGKGFGMENVSTKLKTQGFACTTCNSIFWNAGEVLRCEFSEQVI